MLAALLVIVFFSFATMAHASDGRMQSNCPFTAMGIPLCPQDSIAAAIHHISAYQSILNAPVGSGIMALIIVFLLAIFALLLFSALPLLCSPPAHVWHFFDSPTPASRGKIIHWLSLFENSPSTA